MKVSLSNSLFQVDSEENAVSCVLTLLKKIAVGDCNKNTGVLITGLLEKMSKGDLKKVSILLSSLIDEKLERQFDEKQVSFRQVMKLFRHCKKMVYCMLYVRNRPTVEVQRRHPAWQWTSFCKSQRGSTPCCFHLCLRAIFLKL